TVAFPRIEPEYYVEFAKEIEKILKEIGIDFLGGFSAFITKGMSPQDKALLSALPEILSSTERICASCEAGNSKYGINVSSIKEISLMLKKTSLATSEKDGVGCTKFVVFANAVNDNPFMAGAFHGIGEVDHSINVGISGPGVIETVVKRNENSDLLELAEHIKRASFKITRLGELVGRKTAKILNIGFGSVDLSLAPTPRENDSVAKVLEAMGVPIVGFPGTTGALAILTDAIKKGGAMASSRVGGLSGAFIPVSEDLGMIDAVKKGSLCIEKLEAMTAVCSVGLDMIAVPGTTSVDTISSIILDELSIGVFTNKTTGVRIIPVPGKKENDIAYFGGLLGYTPILPVKNAKKSKLIERGGIVPAPITSLRN
ncbi:MAG TPA: PFL family protein, partial [Thermodesulfobium narugense]|nr:PFL family protein [Thermodesulfobium narugense]